MAQSADDPNGRGGRSDQARASAAEPAARTMGAAERAARTMGAAERAARTVGLAGKTAGWAGHAVLDAAQSLPGIPSVLGRARQLPAAASMLQDAVTPIVTGRVNDWRSEYAYAIGLQAFIYGYPYVESARLRHDWITRAGVPASNGRVAGGRRSAGRESAGRAGPEASPGAPVNQFWHASALASAARGESGCPDADTVHSGAWLDLTDGPVIISYPKAAGRSVTFDLIDFTAQAFDRIGQRAAGRGTEHVAVTGPGWKGRLPAGVRRARQAPTPWVRVLGRFLVAGPADLRAARSWQRQTTLTPLSRWGKSRARSRPPAEQRAVYAPAGQGSDPLAPWRTLNAMLTQNPPPRQHAVLLGQFASIGIGAGLDIDAQPDVIKRGLRRAASVGMPLLRQQFTSASGPAVRDGWRYPQQDDDHLAGGFLRRAVDRSLAGLTADRRDVGYAVGLADSGGSRLSPQGSYSLRFGPDQLPPAESWSLTAYTEPDLDLVAGRAGRCSVSDRTQGLRRDPDGGLTIYLRPTWPGRAREANWLPTSPDQPWFVVLRLYRPRQQAVSATTGGTGWQAPAIRLLG